MTVTQEHHVVRARRSICRGSPSRVTTQHCVLIDV
jgi:hypothetical protein